MQKTADTPLWVYLAFASIETRASALLITYASGLLAIYCIPWVLLFPAHSWVGTVFLLDDCDWLLMMAPMTLWYWLSLRWMDKNARWKPAD